MRVLFAGLLGLIATSADAEWVHDESDSAVDNRPVHLAEAAQSDPAMQQLGVNPLLRADNVEAALKELARTVVTPTRVDPVTVITRVEGDGTTLRYTYEIEVDIGGLPATTPDNLRQHNCTYEASRLLIEAGATMEHRYLRSDGTEIGVVRVNQADCVI